MRMSLPVSEVECTGCRFGSNQAWDKSGPTLHLNLPKAVAMSRRIDTYTELRQQIHDDLRIQHPEWVESDGGSPRCDSYDERLMELLDPLTRRGSNQSVAAIHLALGH